MIFVTVGGQVPFDRMVRAVDEWAGRAARDDVLAQICGNGTKPQHIRSTGIVTPKQFNDYFDRAEVVISHAGMGTIVRALELQKPLLVMPRKASLGEHRNDHQLATAARLRELVGLTVAQDEHELEQWLDRLHEVRPPGRTCPGTLDSLTTAIRDFIAATPPRRRLA